MQALGWIVADAARAGGFLAAAGIGPGNLAGLARDPGFLAGVLDHLLGDEALLLECAADLEIPPQDLAAARAALPGGEVPHWT